MKTLSWNQSSIEDTQKYSPKDTFDAGLRNFQIANTAYPINHNKTIAPYKVSSKNLQTHIEEVWSDVDELLLYAHVPFCGKICSFCELSVVKPKYIESDTIAYFDALKKEIQMYSNLFGTRKKVRGFDIGGGTPSIVDTHYIDGIINQINRNFSLEKEVRISIETTPKIAAEEREKIRDYVTMGIRRISMGVQSLSGKLIGRADTSSSDNRKATKNIRAAGFEQFNIDVMYGFANQENQDVIDTITHIIELNPEFVTLYPMRYKGTIVEGKSKEAQKQILDDQYSICYDMLTAAGYKIRPGKNTCSRIEGNDGLSDYLHHRVLHGMPYLGFGLGAQSFNPKNNLSYSHGAHIKHNAEYIRQVNEGGFPIQDAHHLSKEAAMGKMIAISFFYGGIHLPSFQKVFGITLQEAFRDEYSFLIENGLMEYIEKDEILQLTQVGVKNYSGIISLFYSPATKKYLLDIRDTEWMGKSQSVRDLKSTPSTRIS